MSTPNPKISVTPPNPIGDPRAFRGMSTNLKKLSEYEKKSDFLPSFKNSFGGFVIELVKIVVIALAIIIPIRTFILQPFYVKGASMEPTFHDNEYLIIDELSYRLHQPQRGDVIVLRNPSLGEFLIKRLIGLPDERVVVNDGKITLYNSEHESGVVLDESSYLSTAIVTNGNIDVTLSENQYFVLGDNRSASLDSRSFGPITRRHIIGRTAVRAWPVSKVKTFSTPTFKLNKPTS